MWLIFFRNSHKENCLGSQSERKRFPWKYDGFIFRLNRPEFSNVETDLRNRSTFKATFNCSFYYIGTCRQKYLKLEGQLPFFGPIIAKNLFQLIVIRSYSYLILFNLSDSIFPSVSFSGRLKKEILNAFLFFVYSLLSFLCTAAIESSSFQLTIIINEHGK